MKKAKAIILKMQFIFHVWCIRICQKQFDRRFEAGEDLCSPRIQRLNTRISKHMTAIMQYENSALVYRPFVIDYRNCHKE